jgi:glycosyltransferase involved in cell wall biosynthesis
LSISTRVLVSSTVDLNFIDGSSIWAQSIALAIAQTGAANVDFIAKSVPQRPELFTPLAANPHIRIINGPAESNPGSFGGTRLSPDEIGQLTIDLDLTEQYDVIVVRGLALARYLSGSAKTFEKTWLYLTDIEDDFDLYNESLIDEMRKLAYGCQRLMCQTQGLQDLWSRLVPSLDKTKVFLYPPVIPDFVGSPPPISERDSIAVYAGKYCSEWMTLSMAQSWPLVRRRVPDSELWMIGDKIHSEKNDPEFKTQMMRALLETNGLEWQGAMSREAVHKLLARAKVGLSWRAPSLNKSLEYSTKLLEYGAAGCAAILNRTEIHTDLLGVDYPLFADTQDEYLDALQASLSDSEIAQDSADRLTEAAKRHVLSDRVETLGAWLRDIPPAKSSTNRISRRKTKVLVAGHDLKFFLSLQAELEKTGSFEFLIDHWVGHSQHDEDKSRSLLSHADVIFCEWCLGNLKWYSENKLPHQKLIARFHAQEARLTYFADSCIKAIDHVIFVSSHTRAHAIEVFEKVASVPFSIIPNYIDVAKFQGIPKLGNCKYVLGQIGITPKLKRFDRSVRLLEKLLDIDDRYTLRIKGQNPFDYAWLVNRHDERKYYEEMFQHINMSDKLRHKVVFDPPGDDVPAWLSMVGFLLSPSDTESFHMAVGEAIAAGSKPLVWNWEGAEEIWKEASIVASVEQAAILISSDSVRAPELPFNGQDVVLQFASLLRS